MADVIDLGEVRRRKEDDGIQVVDRTIDVLGVRYTIRTTGDGKRGWFTVRDEYDRMLFAKPAGFPQELIQDLVLAWIDGRCIGRRDAAASWTKKPPGGHII